MEIFCVGFGLGFAVGALLLGIAWQGARRRVKELEQDLDTTVGELVERQK